MKRKYAMSTLFLILTGTCMGQSVELVNQVTSSGGNYLESAKVNLSITIGEPATQTHISSFVIISEGFEHFDGTGNVSVFDPILPTISIFPNPVSDRLTIRSNTPLGEIRVYNNIGQMVLSESTLDSEFEVSMRLFSTGVYQVFIVRNGSTVMEKVLKY